MIEVKDNYHYTPLHISSYYGHLEVVECLAKSGADIEAKSSNEQTPLILASLSGHLSVVKFLVDEGADMEAEDNDHFHTAVHVAASKGHYEILKHLYQKGACADNKALVLASENGFLSIVQFLKEEYVDLKNCNFLGTEALNVAAKNGHLDVVKYLMKNGTEDIRVLINAVEGGQYETVIHLLTLKQGRKYMQSVDLEKHRSPLQIAARAGHLDILKFLIGEGADINSKDYDENSALHYAALNGHFECVEFLFKYEVRNNEKNYKGETPLILASREGHLECVKILLEKSTGDIALSAFINAAYHGQQNVVHFLAEQKTFDINAKLKHDRPRGCNF